MTGSHQLEDLTYVTPDALREFTLLLRHLIDALPHPAARDLKREYGQDLTRAAIILYQFGQGVMRTMHCYPSAGSGDNPQQMINDLLAIMERLRETGNEFTYEPESP